MHTSNAGSSCTILVMVLTRAFRRSIPLSLASMLLVGACSSGITEAPSIPPEMVVTNAIDLVDIVSDVQVRIIPNLPVGAPRNQLTAALTTLSRALDKGFATPVRAAISVANAAVDRIAPSIVEDADARAELDVVRLELDALDLQLVIATRSAK